MAVYLGDQGCVELKRDSLNDPISGTLKEDDVNVDRRRFSFEFDVNALISGDQIEIERPDKQDLVLVSGATGASYRAFVHVDKVGGLRLYETFDAAISGEQSNAIELVDPTEDQQITIKTYNNDYRRLAQVTNFEITTNRETVDITSLGEEFRRSYANGLISGQGSMTCLWDYKAGLCDGDTDVEFPQYLAQLIIRTEQGADFDGNFYIDHSCDTQYVWYEAKCIVTNVAITVTPTQLIRARVQFVMTGDIRLKMGVPPAYIEQEDGSLILLEKKLDGEDDGILMLEDD